MTWEEEKESIHSAYDSHFGANVFVTFSIVEQPLFVKGELYKDEQLMVSDNVVLEKNKDGNIMDIVRLCR